MYVCYDTRMDTITIDTLLLLLVMGLGTARLTALITLDDITENLRDLVFHWFPPQDNDAKGWYYQCYAKATPKEREQAKRFGELKRRHIIWMHTGEVIRDAHFIGRLLSCYKCVSVWVATGNAVLYSFFPEPVLVTNFVLALSFVSIGFVGRYWR